MRTTKLCWEVILNRVPHSNGFRNWCATHRELRQYLAMLRAEARDRKVLSVKLIPCPFYVPEEDTLERGPGTLTRQGNKKPALRNKN